MHAPAYFSNRCFGHVEVALPSNIESRNENPAWHNRAARRNSMAAGKRNENPGGQSQNGSVVPTRAGSNDAVQ